VALLAVPAFGVFCHAEDVLAVLAVGVVLWQLVGEAVQVLSSIIRSPPSISRSSSARRRSCHRLSMDTVAGVGGV
jgi:hypothetical protein